MDGEIPRGMSGNDERYILYYFVFDYINRFTGVWQVGLVFPLKIFVMLANSVILMIACGITVHVYHYLVH